MFFSTSRGQSTTQSDIDATARYLQPAFDIENPRPAPESPPVSPSTRSRAPSETALIYRRERPAVVGAPAPALAYPVPERGRAWLARVQPQAEQTQAEQTPTEQTPASVEAQAAVHTQAAVALVTEPAMQAEPAPIRYGDFHVRPLTPDCVPDTMTVGVCMLASLGGLIGGLAAAYVPK